MPPSADGAPSPGRASAPLSRRSTETPIQHTLERDSATEMKRDSKRARAALRSLHKRASTLRLGQQAAVDSVPPVGEDVRRTVSADPALVAPLLAEADSARAAARAARSSSLRPILSETVAPSFRSTVTANDTELPPPPGWINPRADALALLDIITSSRLNALLIAVPLGILTYVAGWGAVPSFAINFLALIPLALLLGQITEDLAERFGDTIGGLINATFGNVVEMILTLAALKQGLYSVVSASLVGSILSNLLLVLGFCYLVGGLRFPEQRFSTLANKAYCSLLFMACIALLVPTAASLMYRHGELPPAALLPVSRATAVILMAMYGLYLYFTLGTHGDLVEEDARISAAAARCLPSGRGNSVDTEAGLPPCPDDDDDSDDSHSGPSMSLLGALAALLLITVAIAFASEVLCATIEEVATNTGISSSFLGLVLLPIAGNACEHIVAVQVAAKGKMDLAQSIALGSSLQIAVFAFPAAVLFGWGMGKPYTLVLDPYIALVLTLSVTHAYTASADGASNWLLGAQLVGTYCLICLPFLYLAK